MEFKQLIAIFRRSLLFFCAIVLGAVVLALLWQKAQAPLFQATLLLNIGRSGGETTTDYAYDSFYRLQADERFADTVVRWLASPRVVEDIYTEAHLSSRDLNTRTLQKVFQARRLSSQMIEVTYTGPNEKMLVPLSLAATTVLERYTDALNKGSNNKNWFVIIGSDPVIRDGRVGSNTALLVGLALGLFVAFWSVLVRHYLTPEPNVKPARESEGDERGT